MAAPIGNQYAVGNSGKPMTYGSLEELELAIDSYFTLDAYIGEGEDRIFAPTVSGLAYHLGITTQTLRAYGHNDEYSFTVKRAKQRIEISLEQRLAGQAVAGTIFNLKNNFEWKDKSEQELTGPGGGPLQTKVTFVGVSTKD